MEITKSIFVSTIEAIQRESLREENLMTEILDHFPNLKKSGNSPQNLLVRQLLDLLRLEFPREEGGFCEIEHYCFGLNFGKIGGEITTSIDDLWERLDEKRRQLKTKPFAHQFSEEPTKYKFSSFDGTNQLNSNQNVN